MRTVHKFQIGFPSTTLLLHKDAKLVHLAYSTDHADVWFEVDTNAMQVLRQLSYIGTGREVPPQAVHLDTIMDGPYVWHLYDLGEQTPPIGFKIDVAIGNSNMHNSGTPNNSRSKLGAK